MTVQGLIKAVIPGLVALAFSAEAAVVYKYLDTGGNVGYGDQLPAGALLLKEVEVVDSPGAGSTGAENLAVSNALIEQLSKTADRLKRDRQDRDAARIAEEKARMVATQPTLPPVIYREDHYYPYYPGYQGAKRRFSRRSDPGIYKKPTYRRHVREDERSPSGRRAYSRYPYNGPVLTPRTPVITP
ncbi:MAG: DUF4124 domain-containing protein [Porticoccaceae bacterium]|nr:DUF4124 domain-containing protein [Pseudomonadales bacterium]